MGVAWADSSAATGPGSFRVAVHALSSYGLLSLTGWNSYRAPTWYVRSTVVMAEASGVPRTSTFRPFSAMTSAILPSACVDTTVPWNAYGDGDGDPTHEADAGAPPAAINPAAINGTAATIRR